jgi:hypothetical protein
LTSVIRPFIISPSMSMRGTAVGRTGPGSQASAPVVCVRGLVLDLRLGSLLLNLLGLLLISTPHATG